MYSSGRPVLVSRQSQTRSGSSVSSSSATLLSTSASCAVLDALASPVRRRYASWRKAGLACVATPKLWMNSLLIARVWMVFLQVLLDLNVSLQQFSFRLVTGDLPHKVQVILATTVSVYNTFARHHQSLVVIISTSGISWGVIFKKNRLILGRMTQRVVKAIVACSKCWLDRSSCFQYFEVVNFCTYTTPFGVVSLHSLILMT